MHRRSLSNLLGGTLLVATVAALNACGGEAAGGDTTTPSAGTTGTPSSTAGTPSSTGTAGKTSGAPATGTAGTKAAGGTMSTTSGVATAAGKSGGAGTAAAAGATGAAGGGTAAAAGATAAAGSGAAGGAAAAGSSGGGMLGGPLKYTGMFTMGMSIAEKHKCPSMGDNKSPPLSWSGGPADTKSFAIVLFDTTYGMLHWVIWDIPATVNELPEGLAAGFDLMNPMGAHQRAAMMGNAAAYYGPCSGGGGIIAAGKYEYRLYALKTDKLMLTEMSTGSEAQKAVEGAMLEMTVWAGMPM
jgi:Raf kinase inhibitor-like YbhB/YbcL family protein